MHVEQYNKLLTTTRPFHTSKRVRIKAYRAEDERCVRHEGLIAEGHVVVRAREIYISEKLVPWLVAGNVSWSVQDHAVYTFAPDRERRIPVESVPSRCAANAMQRGAAR